MFLVLSCICPVPLALCSKARQTDRAILPRHLCPMLDGNENNQVQQEHLADALALRGDEGRGTLR